MRSMDATAAEAQRVAVGAAQDAATNFRDLRRQAVALARARARTLAGAAQDFAGRTQDRARDLADTARERTRTRIEQRRSTAADTLEELAEALRPRRRGAMGRIAPRAGSALLLAGAMGVGVALGMAVAGQMRARREKAQGPEAITGTKAQAKLPKSAQATKGQSGDGEVREPVSGMPSTPTPYT